MTFSLTYLQIFVIKIKKLMFITLTETFTYLFVYYRLVNLNYTFALKNLIAFGKSFDSVCLELYRNPRFAIIHFAEIIFDWILGNRINIKFHIVKTIHQNYFGHIIKIKSICEGLYLWQPKFLYLWQSRWWFLTACVAISKFSMIIFFY